jgi:hypothetical protein
LGAFPGEVQSAGKGRVSIGRVTHDIDVFETGVAIQPNIAQILPEKPEAFPEKKDGDEREDDNGDERVASKKGLNENVRPPAANGQRSDHWGRSDNFSHPSIMPPLQWLEQIPKCYD